MRPSHLISVVGALDFQRDRGDLIRDIPAEKWPQLLGLTDAAQLTLPLAIRRRDCLPPEIQSRVDRNLARNADYRHGIPAVRSDGQVEDEIIEPEVLAQRLSNRRVVGQLQDSGRGFRETQLLGGCEHPEGFQAAQLGRLDVEIPGQLRAHDRERTLQSRAGVAGAAHDLNRFAVTN